MTRNLAQFIALIASAAFWSAAGLQQHRVAMEGGSGESWAALTVFFGPAIIHGLAAGGLALGIRRPVALLGVADVTIGIGFCLDIALESVASTEWHAFWQLAEGGPPRLAWTFILIVLGLAIVLLPPRTYFRYRSYGRSHST